jgi:hypothetical protein
LFFFLSYIHIPIGRGVIFPPLVSNVHVREARRAQLCYDR